MSVATAQKKWTLQELHRLPDDGNKYELVRGELFVTPPPTDEHETIAAKLTRILDPYVARHGLGYIYRPRAVMRFRGSEVEPDIMVRKGKTGRGKDWDRAPIPTLIVEILSGSTRRRDFNQKRSLYMDAGVAEYWIVDPEETVVSVLRPGRSVFVTGAALTWAPSGAASPLVFDVEEIFSP